MTPIITQIKQIIEDEAKKYVSSCDNESGSFLRKDLEKIRTKSYMKCAELLLPVIEQLIEQRNSYPESDYPQNMCLQAIASDNQELLNTLKEGK